ncbi:acyl-CoA carboxylase subunit epsilon [Salana multivorans]|nr:acyl-CoA carboxylase subunit epsilon [Salana multivorans]
MSADEGDAGIASGTAGGVDGELGGASGADLPGASDRTRLGELYGEMPPARSETAASDGTAAGQAGVAEPVVRVVRGEPDALELAALIAGLTAAASSVDDSEEEATRHRWADRSHALRGGDRGLPERGANAWRWSLHP